MMKTNLDPSKPYTEMTSQEKNAEIERLESIYKELGNIETKYFRDHQFELMASIAQQQQSIEDRILCLQGF